MTKKSAFLFTLLLCTLAIVPCIWLFTHFVQKPSVKKSSHLKCSRNHYFFPLSITKFTASNQPCLDIQIDGQTVSAMLDLGFRGQCTFSSAFLERIETKTFSGSMKMYGVNGIEYHENLFKIPQISIGSLIFYNPELHECNKPPHSTVISQKSDTETSEPELGTLGWELFGQTNLLLDLTHSKLAFCDSLSTLKKHGYDTNKFVRAPLLSQRGLVEFQAQTSKGSLLCILDTGATWNVINQPVEEQDEADNIVTYLHFMVNAKNDIGPIKFHRYPIKMPIHIDVILGMEFFEEHCVFLDFYESYIYFLKERSS